MTQNINSVIKIETITISITHYTCQPLSIMYIEIDGQQFGFYMNLLIQDFRGGFVSISFP